MHLNFLAHQRREDNFGLHKYKFDYWPNTGKLKGDFESIENEGGFREKRSSNDLKFLEIYDILEIVSIKII